MENKEKLANEIVELINEIKWKVDKINVNLQELGAENTESDLFETYMDFPTYDSLMELAKLVKREVK